MLIAVLSCRGKRARAHIKETFIKIRQAKAVSIKICRYDVARLGQYPSIFWRLIKSKLLSFLHENRTMSKVLKIFKQHILYVANSIFGTIPYTHSSSSTFAAFPKVFFVEGLKTEKKEHWQNKARMRFLRPA